MKSGTPQGKTVSIYTDRHPEGSRPTRPPASSRIAPASLLAMKVTANFEPPRSAPSPVTCPTSPSSRSRVCQTMVDTGKAIPASKTVSDEVDKYFGADWRKYGSVDDETLRGTARREREVPTCGTPRRSSRRRATRSRRPGPSSWISPPRSATRRPGGQAPGVPASARARPPAGRAPTGSRMCSCVPRAGHLRPVGRPQDPLQRPEGRRGARARSRPSSGPELRQRRLLVTSSIATATTFQDGGQPILQSKCYMHRQASFYASNWPEGRKVAEDGDVWAFPTAGRSTLIEKAGPRWWRVRRNLP